ncbi:MAG TPA: hypothetical protein VK206_15990, partial [Anaerolineales bacterium]|nr:hypothetical protein [Anaerolineales bacterium]
MKLRRMCHAVLLLCTLLTSGCGLLSAPEAMATTTPGGNLASTAISIQTPTGLDRGNVNLSHLNFLVEDAEIAGQPMAITHIYSEYPHYEWVDASGEGIAAVDDAARAALVYLSDYETRRDPSSLDRARRLLNFVLYMQAEDGQFYNFILDRAGTINQTGNTSFKSSGWWAARAARALATGYRVFRSLDPAYASQIDQAFLRIRDVWAGEVAVNYGKYDSLHGLQIPAWLIAGG